MDSMSIMLPGGLWMDGRLARRAELRPLDGWIEEAMCELHAGAGIFPALIDRVVSLALVRLDGCEVEAAQVAPQLCVADRQALVLALSRQIQAQPWLTAECPACEQRFDLPLALDSLPCSPAGPGYPRASVQVAGQTVELRMPTGADQAAIVKLSPGQAVRVLLQRCVVTVDGKPPADDWVLALGSDELQALDAALDQAAPQWAGEIDTFCPDCGQAVRLRFNPLSLVELDGDELLLEVCALARRCHWSEADIMAMPRTRRRRYLALTQRTAEAAT